MNMTAGVDWLERYSVIILPALIVLGRLEIPLPRSAGRSRTWTFPLWEEELQQSGMPYHLAAHLITMAGRLAPTEPLRPPYGSCRDADRLPSPVDRRLRANARRRVRGGRKRGMTARYLEDFAPGQTFASGQLKVDREPITFFAAEFDPQPFHLDEEAARGLVFKGLAASGAYRGDDHAPARGERA
jgi:hypothetical protein